MGWCLSSNEIHECSKQEGYFIHDSETIAEAKAIMKQLI